MTFNKASFIDGDKHRFRPYDNEHTGAQSNTHEIMLCAVRTHDTHRRSDTLFVVLRFFYFSSLPLFSPICTCSLNIVGSIQYLLFNSAQCICVRPNALQCVTQWTFWNFNAWLARVHMRYTINRRRRRKSCAKINYIWPVFSALSDATMSRGHKRMQ